MKYLIAFKFGPEKVQAMKTQSVRNNISGGVGIRGASTNIKVCCNDDVIAVIGLLQIINFCIIKILANPKRMFVSLLEFSNPRKAHCSYLV